MLLENTILFKNMKSKAGVSYNQFYISGGSANMKGLLKFLNSSLNVNFEHLDPFNELSNKKEEVNGLSYIISIGLALRS